MTDKKDPVRPTDKEAIDTAISLLSSTKYAALAVNDKDSGHPLVSRIAACWSQDGELFFAASDLSVHSKCLLGDPRCSLMIGEPGKGDGLAYARMTVVANSRRMENAHPERGRYRDEFLKTHPKAELYIDFADFGFYPVTIERILLNGGFGKAYHLEKNDLKQLRG